MVVHIKPTSISRRLRQIGKKLYKVFFLLSVLSHETIIRITYFSFHKHFKGDSIFLQEARRMVCDHPRFTVDENTREEENARGRTTHSFQSAARAQWAADPNVVSLLRLLVTMTNNSSNLLQL